MGLPKPETPFVLFERDTEWADIHYAFTDAEQDTMSSAALTSVERVLYEWIDGPETFEAEVRNIGGDDDTLGPPVLRLMVSSFSDDWSWAFFEAPLRDVIINAAKYYSEGYYSGGIYPLDITELAASLRAIADELDTIVKEHTDND